ncbi:hypothetical protein HDU98_007851 [Podochytrium sp. JEL0797]|nr:hypothetical protein HDU98_007851 [Podochytrium sp. JEL0797]
MASAPAVSSYIQSFQVVGKGANLTPDGRIIVDGGWGVESQLDGAVLLRLSKPLKSVRIQIEFRGYCETCWEGPLRLAVKPESSGYKINRAGRIFQNMVEIVYESDDTLNPNPIGGNLAFPFTFNLSKNQLPPSYSTVHGSIQYYIKCTILTQEGMRLLRSSYETETAVTIRMPESAKTKLLESPSQIFHQAAATGDKVAYSVQIPRRILVVGETLELNLGITETPGDARLRMFNASLRTVASYLAIDNTGAQAPIPRPLSEMSQSFPLIKIGGEDGTEPLMRRLFLLVDPEIAQPSIESALISVKTVLRLEIILDDSETPNVHYEIPIVLVPVLSGGTAPGSKQMQRSKSLATPPSQRRRNESFSSQNYKAFSPRSDSLNTVYSPPLLMRQASAVCIAQPVVQQTEPNVPLVRLHSSPVIKGDQYGGFSFLLNELQAMDLRDDAVDIRISEDMMMHPDASWSVKEVGNWLHELGCTVDVLVNFQNHGIDGKVLMSLSPEDLEEIGVGSFGMRRKILLALGK